MTYGVARLVHHGVSVLRLSQEEHSYQLVERLCSLVFCIWRLPDEGLHGHHPVCHLSVLAGERGMKKIVRHWGVADQCHHVCGTWIRANGHSGAWCCACDLASAIFSGWTTYNRTSPRACPVCQYWRNPRGR